MKCPADKILVVASKDGSEVKCYHGGRVFVPLFRAKAFLDLTPFTIPVKLESALSLDKCSINFKCTVTVRISTDEKLMPVAGEKLFGLQRKQISELAADAVHCYARIAIAESYAGEIDIEGVFFPVLAYEVEQGLNCFGMTAVNYSLETDGKSYEYGEAEIAAAIKKAEAEAERLKKEYSPDEGV
ncbi:MAG: hypothetical protein K2N22_02760 [Clostridia bacterium]|nr:hypothetical protein [Clostridia bacterium]